jgi:hypothetical protein
MEVLLYGGFVVPRGEAEDLQRLLVSRAGGQEDRSRFKAGMEALHGAVTVDHEQCVPVLGDGLSQVHGPRSLGHAHLRGHQNREQTVGRGWAA